MLHTLEHSRCIYCGPDEVVVSYVQFTRVVFHHGLMVLAYKSGGLDKHTENSKAGNWSGLKSPSKAAASTSTIGLSVTV